MIQKRMWMRDHLFEHGRTMAETPGVPALMDYANLMPGTINRLMAPA